MIVDSSAIVAIFFQEPGYEELVQKLARPVQRGIGAPTLVESGIVLSARLGQDLRGTLARFIEEANLAVIPFTEAHYGIAVGAWVKYGKGRHPAALNFGDCLAYAVAKVAEMPLLSVGVDFPQTDIALA
jgi:ribonuclease VapC